MQWLVDLIIEAIGIPPTFIDRGDPAAKDFETGDFTADDNWHDLDLSGIVPEDATAIAATVLLFNIAVNKDVFFRKNGNVKTFNVSRFTTQVASVLISGDIIVAVDADRKIEYMLETGGWMTIHLTVKGWWL